MGLRHAKPQLVRFKGCSDAIDGSNAPPGAMVSTSNLIPSVSTQDQWEPRPARDFLADFAVTAPIAGVSPGPIEGFVVYENTVFGLSQSAFGRCFPFAATLPSGHFQSIFGLSLNDPTQLPTNSPATGPTQKPSFAKVGSRILVTHPGFPGGLFNPDNFSATFVGNVSAGSSVITGFFAANVLPGMLITDTSGNIPAGGGNLSTYVQLVGSIDFNVTASGTAGSPSLTVSNASQVVVGMMAAGVNAAVQGFVAGVAGNTVTMDRPVTATFTGQAVSFHGTTITMSQPAIGSATGESITIASGGDRTLRFGWWDISGANIPVVASTVSGSAVITIPTFVGLQPGLRVASGAGVPMNAHIVDLANPAITVAGNPNVFQQGFLTLNFGTLPTDTPPFTFPIVGMTVAGPGINLNTTVSSVSVISQTATTAIVQVGLSTTTLGTSGIDNPIYNFAGLTTITLSAPATATATGVTVTFVGGTVDTPLWGVGDTAINHLPSTPIGVGEFNGIAWFACGVDGIPFSDSGLPCVRTQARQAIVPGNGLAVTACVGQPLSTPITGGITHCLYGFQGASSIQQIVGDPDLGTLSVSPLNIGTGTLSPATIIPTTLGMAFMSPEGLRVIDFAGMIGQPIGEAGSGVTLPFIHSFEPSRTIAAANGDVIRISTQDARDFAVPHAFVEWWYDLARKVWSGPHTLQTSWMTPYVDSFITSAVDFPTKLYTSPAFNTGHTDYEEDGETLTWEAVTALLPDGQDAAMHCITEATLGMKLPSNMAVTVEAVNEAGEVLSSATLPANYTMPLWGSLPNWGSGLWYSVPAFYHQFGLDFDKPLVYKQIQFRIKGTSRFGLALGNLNLHVEQLHYLLEDYPPIPFDISIPALPGAPIINGVPQSLQVLAAAAPGTVLGAVLVQVASYGLAVPSPLLGLTFNQEDALALRPFASAGITGSVSGTAVTGLSANVIAAGWLPGAYISDSRGAIAAGTYIKSIDLGGFSLTLSQPSIEGVPLTSFTVLGTYLVTNWTSPMMAGEVGAEIQAQAQGYLTSTWPFIVTVLPTFALAATSEIILTTDGGVVLVPG